MSRIRRILRVSIRVIGLVVVLCAVYLGLTFAQVWSTAREDARQEVEAIVVLGAAQYNGSPSPVLAARLDHAISLYGDGIAPLVVVTGGNQPGDLFTEAAAGADYLAENGVPQSAILREIESSNSWESLAATARFLRDEGFDEVVLVSDPFHSLRLTGIADEVGLEAHVSPTRSSPITGWSEAKALGRETIAVGVGRLIGYHRTMRLDEEIARLRTEGVESVIPTPG